MDIDQAFPSKYVKCADLKGQDVQVVMSNVVMESVEDSVDDVPILYFVGMKKGLRLNITNKNAIKSFYGSETDNWVGKPITIGPDKTTFGGEIKDCIRVRLHLQPQHVQQPAPVNAAENTIGNIDAQHDPTRVQQPQTADDFAAGVRLPEQPPITHQQPQQPNPPQTGNGGVSF